MRESGEAYKGYLNIFINPDSINETYEATSYWHKDILFDLFLRWNKYVLQDLSKQLPFYVKKETVKVSFIDRNVSSQSSTNP